MIQKTITLLGKEYKMSLNFGAMIAYEQITGKNCFDYKQFMDGRIEPLLSLGYAMIVSNNDDKPEMDAILAINDMQEIQAFIQAVSDIFIDTIQHQPKGDGKGNASDKEDDPKNE